MTEFVVEQLFIGANLDGCTVARASKPNSIIFVRASGGKVFHMNRRGQEIDLTAEWGSNAADRSCYAKLAGVRVKDIENARKVARAKSLMESKTREMRALRATATKLGFRLIRVTKAR